MSFNMGPLCISIINAWFSHARSKHILTLLLALATNTKLLHHSDISSTPRGAIISCCCRLSNSSWNGFCSVYAMHLCSIWYGLLSGLSCNENVPLKHPMSSNTSSKSLCICYIDLALLFCCYHIPGMQWNILLSYLFCLDCWLCAIVDRFWNAGFVYMALLSSLCFLYLCGPLHSVHVCTPLTISCIFHTYRVNVYINYVEHICVWHAQQCLTIPRNYKKCTYFWNISCSINAVYMPSWDIMVLLYVLNITCLFLLCQLFLHNL